LSKASRLLAIYASLSASEIQASSSDYISVIIAEHLPQNIIVNLTIGTFIA